MRWPRPTLSRNQYPVVINYFSAPRQPAVNQSVGRFLFAGYVLWKISAFDWAFLSEWPAHFFDPLQDFLRGYGFQIYLATVACVSCFGLGLFVRVSALGGAVGLMVLGGLHQAVDNQGKRLLIPAILMLVMGIWRQPDRLSLDGLRRFYHADPPRKEELLAQGRVGRLEALRVALVVAAATYFLTAFGRILHGSYWEWTDPANLRRTIHVEALKNLGIAETWYGPAVIESSDLAVGALSHGTMVLELGLLVTVLAGLPIWPVVTGLLAFHFGIFLTMHLLFVESVCLLLPFVNWGGAVTLLQKADPVVIRYRSTRALAATVLMALKQLDVRDTFELVPAGDAASLRGSGWCTVEAGGSTWRDGAGLIRLWAQFRVVGSVARLALFLGGFVKDDMPPDSAGDQSP